MKPDQDQNQRIVTEHPWRKAAQGLWIVLAFLSLLVLLFAVAGYTEFVSLTVGPQAESEPTSIEYGINILNFVFSLSAALISVGLAGLLFWRKRDDNMALFLSYFLLLFGVIMAGPLEAVARLVDNTLIATLAQGILMTLFLPLIYIFPSGKFVPRWSKWLVVVTILITPPMMVLSAGISQGSFPTWGIWITVMIMALLVTGFYGQIYRYRNVSSARERLQTKWVVYGLGLWVGVILISTGPYYYQATLPPDSPTPLWLTATSILWWLSLMIIPVSFSVALLRHKLWDIDHLINRTLVYTFLTGLLLMTYLAFILLTQTMFVAVTGQESPLAIVISTLVIAALFQPLRRRVQEFIDRRFYRRKYDTVQTLSDFAQRARDEVDLEELSLSLIQAVQETMEPETVSLWLKSGDAGER
jgi:hypothetical protein